ncbi:MAG TPA: serine hydrolase domain-containing protein [Kofleriaceae bacterium]|nr:serine hydrolase domain-containing protein [Kofleriaceae bacterium]
MRLTVVSSSLLLCFGLGGLRGADAQQIDAKIDAKKIDAVMKDWTHKDGPGCAVAVVVRGKVVHAKGYGMADLERDVPITPDTVFDIASTSKQLTAAVILLLAADGKLQLDDDIRKYVPELPQLGKAPITIRHLLHHTGGLRDYMALFELTGVSTEDVASVRDTLALLARQRGVDFEPGAQHRYSNTGYFVLAQIAERASKQTMAQLVGDRIFRPLGMARSSVLDSHQRVVRGRAIGYSPKPSGGGWQLDMSGWEQTGDGAVQTTVLDLAKWDENFYDGKVGGRALVDGLQLRGKTSDGKELDYAAGLFHGTYRGQPTVSHSGGWAGYRSDFERFPKLHTSVIVLCNAGSAKPRQLARAIADVVLDKQLAPPDAATSAAPVKLTPAELDVWVGSYRNVKTAEIITVARAGEGLAITAAGQTIPLTPTGKRTFQIAGPEIIVELAGVPPKRTVAVRGMGVDERFEEAAAYAPSAADLAAYAGRYHAPELNALWVVTIKDGALVANGPRRYDAALAASRKDEFSSVADGVTLRFTRTPRGITGFTVGVGQLQGVRFDRLP